VAATPQRARMDPATTTRMLVPVAKLDPFVTPTRDFFVIAHMGIARLAREGWTLAIEGAVERPLRLGYEALTAMPARTLTAVHECYGNPVEPHTPTRRAANIEWTGVPLRDVLVATRPHPRARHVWLEGADWGTFANVVSERYVKDIPLDKALDGDVLLAWAVNGSPLSQEHGFPLRAVVPGFFGTNSVKWLTRLYVADTRPESLFTTGLYNRDVVVEGRMERRPVRELDVQAILVRPADGDALASGPCAIAGWAWSGLSDVARVEISVDGGRAWWDARVEPRRARYVWQRFESTWEATPGRHDIRCRATDAQGRTQPPSGRNRVHAITVAVPWTTDDAPPATGSRVVGAEPC